MFTFFDKLHPAFYMMIAVVFYSVVPVMFELGDADESPFLFTGIWLGSVGIAAGSVILSLQWTLLSDRTVIEDIWSHCKSRLMLFSAIGFCGFAFFAVGLAHVDVSLAAILYETWPIFLIFLMARWFKGTQRYNPITFGTLLFVVMALIGVALVILSQSDAPQPLPAHDAGLAEFMTLSGVIFKVLPGVALVLMGAFCQAASGGTLKIGVLLAKEHPHEKHHKSNDPREIVFVIVMSCICLVFAGFALCAIGVMVSEALSAHQLTYAILGGLFVNSIATFAFRYANLKTDDLGVNALAYATPLVTLIWLFALSTLDVSRLDFLIIGAMGIVASNLLINVDASDRLAYKALIVSLWLFGTITYFYDGFTTDVPLELPVTIYILVLAFRVERLARRTSQEEVWVFDAFRSIRSMAAKENIPKGACTALIQASRALLDVDHHKSAAALKNAYERTLGHLENARMAGIPANEITEICRMIDKLAHSRQQGSRFGEIVAIALTGLLIVLGLLAFNGERGVYGDIASFVLSSVLVFLFFNIVDLQRDRKDETIVRENRGRYFVNFGRVDNRERAQYVSMTISGVIVFVFVVLFFAKA